MTTSWRLFRVSMVNTCNHWYGIFIERVWVAAVWFAAAAAICSLRLRGAGWAYPCRIHLLTEESTKKTVVSEHERHRQAMLWTQSHWQRQWRVSRVDSVKGVFYLCVCVRVEGVRSRWSRRDSCKGEVKCACVCVCPAVSFIFLQLRQYITHADSTEPQEVQKCDTRLQNSVFCIQVQ